MIERPFDSQADTRFLDLQFFDRLLGSNNIDDFFQFLKSHTSNLRSIAERLSKETPHQPGFRANACLKQKRSRRFTLSARLWYVRLAGVGQRECILRLDARRHKED